MLASRMASAEPRRFPVAIFLMNRGTSICVGHAVAQGASKQYRQRLDSTMADCESNAGCRSENRTASSSVVITSSFGITSSFHEGLVHIGAAVAEELPGLADFGDHVQVEIGGEHFVLVAGGLGDDAARR